MVNSTIKGNIMKSIKESIAGMLLGAIIIIVTILIMSFKDSHAGLRLDSGHELLYKTSVRDGFVMPFTHDPNCPVCDYHE